MEKVKEVAFDLDCVKAELRGHGDIIDDIHSEVFEMTMDLEESGFEFAQIKYEQVKRKLRLMETLLLHAKRDFEKTFKEMDELTDALSIEVLRDSTEAATPQSPNFTAARIKEKFVQDFGRAPQSEAEVGNWIEDIISGKRTQEVK